MLKKLILLIAVSAMLMAQAQTGDWRVHPYYVGSQITNLIDTDNKIYYLVGNDLFCFDKATMTNEPINKRNKLNDVLITNIYYNYNNVTIVDQRPVQIGLIGLLDAFINFRKEVVRRRSLFEKKQMEDRCHIIEGLMKAVSILDEVIALIRASKDKADAKKGLMETFGFDDKQAEAIVMMRLYRLSNTDIVALRNEFAELTNKIEEVNDILENENVMRSVIVKELRAVKKEYDDPRRTRIEENVSAIVIDKAATIANERVMVTVSRDGYVKRVSMKPVRS